MNNEAEEVQTIGMIGIAGENATIELLRLTKPPGLMVSRRFRQGRTGSEVRD